MRAPPPHSTPLRGDTAQREPGFSYLPRFFSADDAEELAEYTASIHPIWEHRYAPGDPRARGASSRLTRPVYWLGAWQFACLGYYSEPDHIAHRCVRAEPFPPVLQRILKRLEPELIAHGQTGTLPNTCLINYYGSERLDPNGPPVDHARLRMHRDQEPGPVAMISIGQPAQFEFVIPGASAPEHAQWVRHRSAVIISGPEYKDRLYHRVTRVRHGGEPVLSTSVHAFSLRRVSISFRHVPDSAIWDFADLPAASQQAVKPFVDELAEYSEHFRAQLRS